ncbi:hypothetical protein KDW_59240 [Dictyobacter vulcani]|uniref:6,7-dimethyl-8-ribityllumazine synthase n=1 Tax=Dictyobacter vulcani TaxID=2607529 RepID=A0A5J4KXA2_9CHLR|nr:hypothetical protein KDW_59240 [Dictyobacter vulcani]
MQASFLGTPAPTELNGSGLKVGIVAARYNWPVTGALLALAYEELVRLHVAPEQIEVVHAPGAYELATVAQAMLSTPQRYDALICIGCVMKGATRHDILVGDAAAQGVQRVASTAGSRLSLASSAPRPPSRPRNASHAAPSSPRPP